MIESFEVSNFKLFEHLKLEGLGRVNLIVGANNTGKTALLEALYLDGRRDFAAAVIDIMRQRKQSGKPTLQPHLSSWFRDTKESLKLGTSTLYVRANWGRPELHRDRQADTSSVYADQSLNDALKQVLPYQEDFEDSLAVWQSGLDEELRDLFWDQLLLRGQEEIMHSLLRTLIPSIRKIGLVNDGHTYRQPYYTAETAKQYPLSRLGQGMNRLLGLASGMAFTRGQRLLVDEIETGLHYEAMEQVWRWVFESAGALDVQVFATTHSIDCVKAFARAAIASPDLGRLYRLDTLLGPLRAVGYTERQLGIAAEQGIEVR